MNPGEPKVFGIGLSKTGTSSLDRALNELGIRSIHFPCDRRTHGELAAGNYRLSVLQQYRAATDISVAPFYAQLDHVHPGSKFILTVRELEPWLESVRRHWEFQWRWAEHERQFRAFLQFITACTYGMHGYERERFTYVYQRHVSGVREYFRDRPDGLLVLDICGGEGWERLCPFLGLPVPALPFPRANRREEKLDRIGWIETLEQAVREFQATVPAAARYVLIDDQQLAGSGLEDPPRVQRLLERDGVSWAPPADSAAAIAAIEQLRQDGLGYLVIAWPSFWWLDHYRELDAHLNSSFQPLLHNERLLVMDLRAPRA